MHRKYMIIPSLEEYYDFLAENLASGPKNQTAKMRITCHENKHVKEDKPSAVFCSRANLQVETRLKSLVEFEVCTISLASVSLRHSIFRVVFNISHASLFAPSISLPVRNHAKNAEGLKDGKARSREI